MDSFLAYGQEFTMPTIILSLAYYLMYYPGYFPAVTLGFGAFILTPIGGWALAPHANMAVDFVIEEAQVFVTEIIASSIADVAQQGENAVQLGYFTANATSAGIDEAVQTLNMSTQGLINITKKTIREVTYEVGEFEEQAAQLSKFITKTIVDTFELEFWLDFTRNLIAGLRDKNFLKNMMQGIGNTLLAVLLDNDFFSGVFESSKQAIVDVYNEGTYVADCQNLMTQAATHFKASLKT